MLMYKTKAQISFFMVLVIIFVMVFPLPVFAENETAYYGIPLVTLNISDLDSSGNLIYIGIDFGVFADKTSSGSFSCVKAQRFLTRSTNITIDLGDGYEKGVKHKCAYRILYVAAGTSQDEIIIANYSNGKQGWIPLNDTLFSPSFFVGGVANAVTHTALWTANREAYNAKNPLTQRTSGVWWSGEKFILDFTLNEATSKVKVGIEGYPEYSTTFTTATSIRSRSAGKYYYDYDGEIFDSSMINKWGNYIPQKLTFTFTILDSSENVLEEQSVDIFVDNRYSYFRVRKVKI